MILVSDNLFDHQKYSGKLLVRYLCLNSPKCTLAQYVAIRGILKPLSASLSRERRPLASDIADHIGGTGNIALTAKLHIFFEALKGFQLAIVLAPMLLLAAL